MEHIILSDEYSEQVSYPNAAVPIKTWLIKTSDFPDLSDVNHWHNDFEFCYVIKGYMKQNVNGEIIDMNEGDLLFINSGSMHFGFQTERSDCRMFCIMLNPAFIINSAVNDDISKIIRGGKMPYFHFMHDNISDVPVISTAKKVHSLTAYGAVGFELMETVYKLFRLLLERSSTDRSENIYDIELEIMHRMTGFIQKNYGSKIKLSDIAGAGFVCRSKCCRIFKRFLQKTPIEYLIEYRISKSLELFRHSDMTVTEIAHNCGFSGASYFTETFLKIMKCTPSEFRKR